MKTVIGLLLGVVLLLGGYTWLVLHWSYSSGERAGYVQKFSRKGWVCKTWEGEMALVSMPGTVAEKFFFSVRDDAVATRINDSVGRRVSLTYEQHIGIPDLLLRGDAVLRRRRPGDRRNGDRPAHPDGARPGRAGGHALATRSGAPAPAPGGSACPGTKRKGPRPGRRPGALHTQRGADG